MNPIKWWNKIKEDRKLLEDLTQDKEDLSQENQEALEHLSNVLFEFYKVWQRHEGKNKPCLLVHQANQFVFDRDGGELGAKIRQKKLDKREEIWKQGNGVCYLCQKPLKPDKWTIDHVVPISKGGSESLSNLMPTHKSCNERKADRIFEDGKLFYGEPW